MTASQDAEQVADTVATYRDTIQPLYAFVFRRVGGARQLAEDITQETYLRAVAAWRNGKRPDHALAWLQTVARNLIYNHYRRKKPESLEASNLKDILESAASVGDDAAALVCWGLARMRRRPRELLEAYYIDGKNTRSIASDLGVSERAVEGRLRRAREALKNELKPIVHNQGDWR